MVSEQRAATPPLPRRGGVGEGLRLNGSEPSAASVLAAIGLGANLGDRASTITRAIELLDARPGVAVRAISSFVETPALVMPGSAPQPPYLNGAVAVETTLGPRDLLDALLEIERALGRDRTTGERWAARTIDLDLLLYADRAIDEDGLVVPHPRMHERDFVLLPLAEVAADAMHPTLNATIRELLERLRANG